VKGRERKFNQIWPQWEEQIKRFGGPRSVFGVLT
jgi:hypothetical protein